MRKTRSTLECISVAYIAFLVFEVLIKIAFKVRFLC